MLKLTTRGYAVAEAIRDRMPFKTSGALRGGWRVTGDSGSLRGDDLTRWSDDCDTTTGREMYVVLSYSTPIAWWTEDRGWYKVAGKFSVTTSRHQGKLYMVG